MNERPETFDEKMRGTYNLVDVATNVGLGHIAPVTRSHAGTRAFRVTAPIAAVIMYAYSASCPPMRYYLALWCVCLCLKRRDRAQKTYYAGWVPGFAGREYLGRFVEALAVCGLGYLLTPAYPRLGQYFTAISWLLFVRFGLDRQINARRRDAIGDARKEMEDEIDRMRRGA